MTDTKMSTLILPALRGVMGRWVYYSCLMNMRELAARVRFAEEVHNNPQLSKLIQRKLTDGRGTQIAQYLETQSDRFFNSLVVATYGGAPNWYALSDIKAQHMSEDISEIDEDTVASVGFLTLNGTEKLFALDGQHRLAGIKKAVKDAAGKEVDDEISVIFVAHENTPQGLERTRRLFTVLNKTAKPVSKGDIIALDEDDVAAICVRRLIENTGLFSGERIAYVANNNMPATNTTSLTTIGNLYDTLLILFSKAKTPMLTPKKDALQFNRPSDAALDKYFGLAQSYFELLKKNFDELNEFFAAEDYSAVVKKHRGSHGGSALFRPIGLSIFTQIIANLTASMSLEDAVDLAAKLPRTLSDIPYDGLLWDENKMTIKSGNNVTLRDTLLVMAGDTKVKRERLIERYRRALGDPTAVLPAEVV